MTTHDDHELTPPQEETPPALRAPLVAVIGGLILTIALFLVLGTGAGKKLHATKPGVTPTVTIRAPQQPPAISVPPPPSVSPSAAKRSVRWHGTVTIQGPDAHKDLDYIPPRTYTRDSDLNGDWLETTLKADAPNVQIAVTSGNPGYAKCRDTAYADGTGHTDELSAGDVLCVLTSQRRVARLQTLNAGQTGLEPVIKFNVTVWDPPAQ